MSLKKTVVYFVIPLIMTLTLVAMYFSGVESLQQIVSPRMPGLNPNVGREMGLLENLENLTIAVMFATAIAGLVKKKTWVERTGFACIAVFTAFIFLEEIDYGIHYYEYYKQVPMAESARVRNWHNQGQRTDIAKRVVDTGMILFFVIAPLAFAKSTNPIRRFLTPDRYSILTMIAATIAGSLAHELDARGYDRQETLRRNLSEFRELITYYVFALYLVEIAIRRRLTRSTIESENSASM